MSCPQELEEVGARSGRIAGKSRSQKLFSQVASALFNFGIDNDYCAANPAARMKRLGKAKAFVAWSDEQCAAFENSKPARHLLTAYIIGRFTGQRRGDVLRMARSAYDGGCIAVRQEKTGEPVVIPAHRRLKAYLDDLPKDSLLFVVDAKGRPVAETAFSKEFRLRSMKPVLPSSTSTACGTAPDARSQKLVAAVTRSNRSQGIARCRWSSTTRKRRGKRSLPRPRSRNSREREQNAKVLNQKSRVLNFGQCSVRGKCKIMPIYRTEVVVGDVGFEPTTR